MTFSDRVIVYPQGLAYFFEKGEWSRVSLNDTSDAVLQAVNGRLFAFNGSSTSIGVPQSVGHFMKPDGSGSVALPHTSSEPSVRSNPAVVVAGDQLFVWGGCGRRHEETCDAFLHDVAILRMIMPPKY